MRFISWLLRAFIFFVLFAFALNNQQVVTVNWFFGAVWRAPMVIVVLAVFACGCVLGVLAMLPGWWRSRRALPAGSTAAAGHRPELEPDSRAAASAPPSELQMTEAGATSGADESRYSPSRNASGWVGARMGGSGGQAAP